MKRIGILLTSEGGGGTFQYTQAMLDAVLALPRSEYTIVAAVTHDLWLDRLDASVEVVRLADTSWNRALNRIWHLSRLPVSLWRRTAAHLDSNASKLVSARCNLWICPNHERYSFRARVPAVGTVHDLMHRYESRFPEVSEHGEFESREFHFRETCRWARGVIVDSNIGARQVAESYGIDPAKVYVLPYIAPGYILDRAVSENANTALHSELPGKFFFYPAQFYRHKNHSTLIAAVARMRDAHPDVRLVLVGARDRNGYDDLRRQVESLALGQNVIFLGYVRDEDMAGLYERARALVMPTYFGPTNIPQLEAFALGCPVATSRIYGIPEQVGDAALLFDPSSVDEIHDALVRLWTDEGLCAELAARGREHSRRWGRPQFRVRVRQIVDALA